MESKAMIGARLVHIRNLRGLTQTQVAEMVNQSQSNYSRYERDIYDPTCSVLKQLCIALAVSPEYLLGLSGDPGIVTFDGEQLSDDETALISCFRRCSPEGRRMVLAAARSGATADPMANSEGGEAGIA